MSSREIKLDEEVEELIHDFVFGNDQGIPSGVATFEVQVLGEGRFIFVKNEIYTF